MADTHLELLLRRLVADANELADVTQEQIKLFSMRDYETVIEIGNIWVLKYPHAPYAMLLDLWSARAQSEMKRQNEVIRHLLRADQIYRRWERSVKAYDVKLTFEERVILQILIADVMDQFELLLDFGQNNGCIHFLWEEYRDKSQELN